MLRVLLTPRWLGWTLLALLALGVCGVMTWWQVIRLESPGGSLLNAGYAFQWPLFGLFFAFLWWRMLRAEARPPDAGADPEPASDRDEPSPRAAAPARDARRRIEPVRAPDASSPFGPRPAGVTVAAEAAAPGSARARHNAHLAELAGREPSSEDRP